MNLITTRLEFTLLQCSTTLSSLITSFCIIFDICKMINYRSIYIPEYSQNWFQHAVLNLITTRLEFTLLQCSTTLKLNHIILYHIWYLLHDKLPFYIYIPEYSQYWFQNAVLNLITTRLEFTLLQCSTTLSSLITSFCIIFDICKMINYRSIYIPEYSQNWFQHAVLNLITTRLEFTLLQCSTTLKLNHIILYHIWYLLHDKLPFYIYIPEYSQYWFQNAVLNLITTWLEFTLLQCSTTLSSLITSFCIIFDICKMINYRFIYIQ